MKICSCCKVEKPLFEFSPDKRISSGVQSRCKPCYASIMRERRKKNPAAHREAVKRNVKKHYEKKLARNQTYRKNNPDKVFEWKKSDRVNNKIRIQADNAKRRSLMKGDTSSQIQQLYALRDFFKSMSLGDDFHVDHIVPLSRGGQHIYENLRVIPAIDNLRKGANF